MQYQDPKPNLQGHVLVTVCLLCGERPKDMEPGHKCEWRPIDQYTEGWVEVRTRDGCVLQARYAQNTSGEDREPFHGWFIAGRLGRSQRIWPPVAWRPLATSDKTR